MKSRRLLAPRGLGLLVAISHILVLTALLRYPLFTYDTHVDIGLQSDLGSHNSSATLCPFEPPGLDRQSTLTLPDTPPSLEMTRLENPAVESGGRWRPRDCVARQTVAVIVPYRHRWQHLLYLLPRLHSLLQRQQCDYQIFVAEQVTEGPFNKGRVMNLGFWAASELRDWDCYIFHDVDLIPELDETLYRCRENPLHLSAGVDQLRYTLMYKELVGGVLALSPQHFRAVNGYSNDFWGWGGEDDDMNNRIQAAGLTVIHTSTQRGRYKMLPHVKGRPSLHRAEMLSRHKSSEYDGLSTLPEIDGKVLSVDKQPLYVNITIDVGRAPAVQTPTQAWWWQRLLVNARLIFQGF